MTTNQDSNWTLFYARSNSDPNRHYKVMVYQGRCYACECKGNRLGRKECCHIKAVKAGIVKAAAPKQPTRSAADRAWDDLVAAADALDGVTYRKGRAYGATRHGVYEQDAADFPFA